MPIVMKPFTVVVFGVPAILLCSIVVVLIVWEVVRFRRGQSLLDRRQLGLRCAGALLLTTLIVQVCGGLAFVRYTPDPTRSNPRAAAYFIGYWLTCGLLTMALLVIVRIDFIMLARKRLAAERKLAREQMQRRAAASFNALNGAPHQP